MKDDLALLRDFVTDRSETAFAELVRRHIDLVYSVALRHLRGDSHLARDAAQAVFCELARKAPSLTSHRTLSGWLYNTARFVAHRLYRTETRRTARELAFAINTPEHESSVLTWNDLEHVLDDAMQELSKRDREAVILRYFRNEPLAAIGKAIGSSENAARMRVERALEKLRAVLGRRGVRCPSSVLAAILTTNAVSNAPAGLAAAVTAPAIAGAAATLSWTQTFNVLHFMSAAKIKTIGVCLALAGTTTGLVLSHRRANQLESELKTLRQASASAPSESPNPGSQVLVDPAELARLRAQHSELMRLRDQVTQLRREQQTAGAQPAPTAADSNEAGDAERQRKDDLKNLGIARLRTAQGWGLAIYRFAHENGGRLPENLLEASKHFPQEHWDIPQLDLTGSDFEIMYEGALSEIANPAQAIILRERTPFAYSSDGAPQRTYLFADGHSEVKKAPDGNFEAWEEERRPILKQTDSLEPGGE